MRACVCVCVRVRTCVRMYNMCMYVNNVWHTQKHSPCPSDHTSDTELEMGAQSLFLIREQCE